MRAFAIALALVLSAVPAFAQDPPAGAMLYPDGSYRFAFGGLTRPTISIHVGDDCDIILQNGEKIHDVFISDSARWKVATGWSGPDVGHVVVKPTQSGLRTALTIMTDRRTYHIDLVSTNGTGEEVVGFYYPQTAAELSARIALHQRPPTPPQYACANLDSAYTAQGPATLRPVSVCNDGKQTYVNMPQLAGDLPIVKAIDAKGKDTQVTYTFDAAHDEYAVDGTPDRLVLIRARDRLVLARDPSKTTASTGQPGGKPR